MTSELQQDLMTLPAAGGVTLFVHRWLPEAPPRAVVQVAHGIAEHGGRYARLGRELNDVGYAVYADDHRGHGRTAGRAADLGFLAESHGWQKCIDDLWLLNRHISNRHPGVPVVLLGHSMGSFMAQHFISEHGDALAGVVLAGSNGKPGPRARLVRLLARFEQLRLGPRGRSALVHALALSANNKPFEPARTPFDWLSSDPVEVDKYIADPMCRFRPTVQLWVDLIDALHEIARPERQARIPKHLPVYVIAGTCDPVGSFTQGLGQLLGAYRAAGLRRVTHDFYPGARHELFNETNRDDVTRDLICWLDALNR
jgi:alpha-beta hydrolase superfamily lysophospholipase